MADTVAGARKTFPTAKPSGKETRKKEKAFKKKTNRATTSLDTTHSRAGVREVVKQIDRYGRETLKKKLKPCLHTGGWTE
jgi:hypothetical protein